LKQEAKAERVGLPGEHRRQLDAQSFGVVTLWRPIARERCAMPEVC
jgi:hypothetical protein